MKTIITFSLNVYTHWDSMHVYKYCPHIANVYCVSIAYDINFCCSVKVAYFSYAIAEL